MDCGSAVDRTTRQARCVAMVNVKRGDSIIVGRLRTRVFPAGRGSDQKHTFGFMNSTVSSENQSTSRCVKSPN